jgi:dienelactone hydrolase
MKPVVFETSPVFWFETLRAFSHVAYGGADFGEVLLTAQRIEPNNYDSWYEEWSKLGQRIADEGRASEQGGHRVTARDSYLRASNYWRMAEFFLHGTPADPRVNYAFNLSVEYFRSAAALFDYPVKPVEIPFEDTSLPGYFYRAPGDGVRPTVVVHSGYDGTVEENHFFGVSALVERGYHVLSFDGPGQPGMMHREGMVFRPDWEVPVAAALDYLATRPEVDFDRVALMGISMGGVLAPRAAAMEPRIKALVAFDGIYNLGENTVNNVVPGTTEEKVALLRADAAPELDATLAAAMTAAPSFKWAIENGQWVFGVSSPREVLRKMMLDYNLVDGVAEKIACPTLVCEGVSDQFVAGEAERLYEHLTCPKTLITFTVDEAADAHCQIGAMRLTAGRIGDWLDDTFAAIHGPQPQSTGQLAG